MGGGGLAGAVLAGNSLVTCNVPPALAAQHSLSSCAWPPRASARQPACSLHSQPHLAPCSRSVCQLEHHLARAVCRSVDGLQEQAAVHSGQAAHLVPAPQGRKGGGVGSGGRGGWLQQPAVRAVGRSRLCGAAAANIPKDRAPAVPLASEHRASLQRERSSTQPARASRAVVGRDAGARAGLRPPPPARRSQERRAEAVLRSARRRVLQAADPTPVVVHPPPDLEGTLGAVLACGPGRHNCSEAA